jgi:hypothetical protein
MQTHLRGDATEATVIAELKRRAIPVSKPVGDNERYDVLVETPENRILRVQIKTGRLTDGKIDFHTRSQHTNSTGNSYEKYDGDVDYFFVYTPELETIHVVGEWEFDSSMKLRVEEPEQVHHTINWAEEYEFDERWPPQSDDCNRARRSQIVDTVAAELKRHELSVARSLNLDGCDIIVESDGKQFQRITVTPGWLRDGCVTFDPGSTDRERLDWFVVYAAELKTCYLVSSDEFDKSISLRVDDDVQNRPQINWAEEYELVSRVDQLT